MAFLLTASTECVYRFIVVLVCECPKIDEIVLKSAPFVIANVANVCLKE